ncbi:MAG: hypothetical protein LBJ63_01775 [Prevotellaceae bacterium]|nr:hypothetical protein [Prevotellaceae bacterium]
MKRIIMNKRYVLGLILCYVASLMNVHGNENKVNEILTNNIWFIDSRNSTSYERSYLIKFFKDGRMIIFDFNRKSDFKEPNFISVYKKYTIINNEISFSISSYLYNGTLEDDSVIYGKGTMLTEWGEKELKSNLQILTDPVLLANYNKVLSFNPFEILPNGYDGESEGPFSNEIYIQNKFNYYVAVGIYGEKYKFFHLLKPKGSGLCLTPNGKYEMYFVYYNDKTKLRKGDNINIKNQNITVTLEKAVGGNYNIQ